MCMLSTVVYINIFFSYCHSKVSQVPHFCYAGPTHHSEHIPPSSALKAHLILLIHKCWDYISNIYWEVSDKISFSVQAKYHTLNHPNPPLKIILIMDFYYHYFISIMFPYTHLVIRSHFHQMLRHCNSLVQTEGYIIIFKIRSRFYKP